MIIADFHQFCDDIVVGKATVLVQHVLQRIMLRMNEHEIHGVEGSILRYKMKMKLLY